MPLHVYKVGVTFRSSRGLVLFSFSTEGLILVKVSQIWSMEGGDMLAGFLPFPCVVAPCRSLLTPRVAMTCGGGLFIPRMIDASKCGLSAPVRLTLNVNLAK